MSHAHESASNRRVVLRDGTRRDVITCACGAVRHVDEEGDERRGTMVRVGPWFNREHEAVS